MEDQKRREPPLTSNEVLAHSVSRFFDFASVAARVGFPSWAVVEVFQVAAGEETVIKVFSNAFEQAGPDPFVYGTIGILFMWAVGENSLRRSKTAYFQDRIKFLESQMDIKRTSSGLTATGTTNPEDRVP